MSFSCPVKLIYGLGRFFFALLRPNVAKPTRLEAKKMLSASKALVHLLGCYLSVYYDSLDGC
jgi:hypothetical protein